MIKILIITDDMPSWMWEFNYYMNFLSKKIYLNYAHLSNDLFDVVMTSTINEQWRGQQWNTIILDKSISNEIYTQILVPSCKSIITVK